MNFKNFILGLGIFIVYALVLWQGIQAFYPAPEYDEYCDYIYRTPIAKDQADCTLPAGFEDVQNACYKIGGEFRYEYDSSGCISGGYCDECSIKYNEAQDGYSRNVFVISLIAGILTFVAGFFVLKSEPVGSALLASGLWAVFYGTVWNWRNFGNGLRFGILLLVLLALIWIAVRLNRQKKKGFFFGIGIGRK